MKSTILNKLLATSALIAGAAVSTSAVAATTAVNATGNVATNTTPGNGTAGDADTANTNQTAGSDAAEFGGASVTGTLTGNQTGGTGGAGSANTDNTGNDAGTGATGGYGVDLNGQTSPTLAVGTFTVTGGAGGVGGAASDAANTQDGGIGGVGAAGVRANGTTLNTISLSTGSIVGGAGGQGGATTNAGTGGAGGNGGVGVAASTSTTIAFSGAGSITGGAGGAGGSTAGGGSGAAGSAAAGVLFSGSSTTLTITGATGTIAGGNSGAATAISVTGDATTISNAAIVGGAAHAGDALNIAVGGTNTVTSVTNTGTLQSSTGNALELATGDTITTFANTGGTITAASSTGTMNIIGTITALNNTASGQINATGAGIGINLNGGAITTLTNSATISSSTGAAINVANVAGSDFASIINTGGTITSANVTATSGAIAIDRDLGGAATITGGAITNTANSTDANAIYIGASQTGALTVNGNAALTAGGAAGGTAVRFAATGALTLDGTATITATDSDQRAVFATTGDQTVLVNGGTITAAAATHTILELGDGADVLTYAKASSATGITGVIDMGSGNNDLNINESFTTGGTITTSGEIDTVVAANKTLTANHNLTLNTGDITLNAGSALVLARNVTVGANLASLNATSLITFQVGDTSAAEGTGFADLNFVNASGIATASQISVDTVAGAGGAAVIRSGDAFKIIDSGAAVTDINGTLVADDSFLYNFALYDGDNAAIGASANDYYLKVSRNAALTAPTDAVSANANALIGQLETIGAAGSSSFDSILVNMANASTQEAFNNVAETVAPTVDSGAQESSLAVVSNTTGIISDRAAAQRGAASGDESLKRRFWVKGFGTTADQDRVDGVDGYEANGYGFAAGVDRKINNDKSLVGVALTYGVADVDSDNAARTQTDVDSYQVTLYGDHSFANGLFVEGQAGYSLVQNDTSRFNIGGVSGLNGSADYDANVYSAAAKVGKSYQANRVTVTPALLAQYTAYDAESYTETWTDTTTQSVDPELFQALDVGAEVELAAAYALKSGATVKPNITAGYLYDVINDDVEVSSRFSSGGTNFLTNGAEYDAHTIRVGAGVDFISTKNWELSANYDLESRDEFLAHSGSLKAAFRF